MKENIKIIKIFDLVLYNTKKDYKFLYASLCNVKKNFAYNEKIVFIHTETDFYHKGSDVGFTIYNLFCLIHKVNISLSAICFITTNNNLEKDIKPFITHKNDKPMVITTLVSQITYNNLCRFKHIIPHNKNIKFKALCMIGTLRSHRIMLYKFFQSSNLKDDVEISVNNKNNLILSDPNNVKGFSEKNQENSTKCIDNQLIDELGLIFSTTARNNENWCNFLKNRKMQNISNVQFKPLKNSKHIEPNDGDFYNHFAVDIVTETCFDYPHNFVSEKTLRPLYLKKPFIIVGPPNFLKYLHSYGFQTFNDLWNEDYDKIKDPQKRFIACAKTIESVLSLPLNDLISMLSKVESRLEKNRQILINYIENIYHPLYNNMHINKFLDKTIIDNLDSNKL